MGLSGLFLDWLQRPTCEQGARRRLYAEMLKKAEKVVPLRNARRASGTQLSFHGDLGQKDGLYRVSSVRMGMIALKVQRGSWRPGSPISLSVLSAFLLQVSLRGPNCA